jgi:hypothetical protein
VDAFIIKAFAEIDRRVSPHKDDSGQRCRVVCAAIDDRADAEAVVVNNAPEELRGDWRALSRTFSGEILV